MKNLFLKATCIAVFAILGISIFSTTVFAVSRPSCVPPGANWRIDQCPIGSHQARAWYDVRDEGNWGQAQCCKPGCECGEWDMCTWWYSILIGEPNPPADPSNSIYGTIDFPSYDPIELKYYY